MKFYEHFCKECQAKTTHKVFSIMRKSGIKLSCVRCLTLTKYLNVEKIVEIELRTKCRYCNLPLMIGNKCSCDGEKTKWTTRKPPSSNSLLKNHVERGLN